MEVLNEIKSLIPDHEGRAHQFQTARSVAGRRQPTRIGVALAAAYAGGSPRQ
jgi:hypothetical protein